MSADNSFIHNREAFYRNPTINPETGRTIKIGAGTYQQLVKRYGTPPSHKMEVEELSVVNPSTPQVIPHHFEIPDYGNRTVDDIMAEAAEKGDLQMVRQMIDEGAGDFDRALIAAAYGGHYELVELFLAYTDYREALNEAMREAAAGGHIQIVELLLEDGADDYNGTLQVAAEGGHLQMVRLMKERGANDYYDGLLRATANGHLEVVKYLLPITQVQRYRYRTLVEVAKRNRRGDVVKYIEGWLADRSL